VCQLALAEVQTDNLEAEAEARQALGSSSGRRPDLGPLDKREVEVEARQAKGSAWMLNKGGWQRPLNRPKGSAWSLNKGGWQRPLNKREAEAEARGVLGGGYQRRRGSGRVVGKREAEAEGINVRESVGINDRAEASVQ